MFSTLMEIAITVQIAKELVEKHLLPACAGEEIAQLEREFNHEKEDFFASVKRRNAEFSHVDIMSMSSAELVRAFGLNGVDKLFFENFKRENIVAKDFRNKLANIIK